jgi:hypothetical protein
MFAKNLLLKYKMQLTLNVSDIATNIRTVILFVFVDLQTIFHT